MDPFFLEAVVAELQQTLAGARLDKVYQPAAELLTFRLWNGRETLRLLFGVTAAQARLHLTDSRLANPFTPARFCQLLRSRLTRIIRIEKIPHERIVHFYCQGPTGENYLLVAELFGMKPNLFLLDAGGVVIDTLKHPAGLRDAVVGHPYVAPVPPQRHSLADSLPEIPSEATGSPAAFERWLLDSVSPMSPLVAGDLAAAVAQGVPAAEAMATFRRHWLERKIAPAIASRAGQAVLLAFPLYHLPIVEVEEFLSPSAAAERFFQTTVAADNGEKAELRTLLGRARQRLQSRQKNIAEELRHTENADRERHFGELLLANFHRLKRGMNEVVVDDYHSDPPVPVTIPLDPLLTPQANAECYFRGYKKKKKGVVHAQRRLAETAEQIDWLQEMDHFLDEAETGPELQVIRGELAAGGFLPRTSASPAGRKAPDFRQSLRRSQSPGGFQICWGKNSRTNDYISRELTAADDLWFHAHGIPGCHLVLKRAGRRDIPEEDQLFAAAVAAGYSRGSGEGKVEVMVAEGKYVRSPKGARPGLVTVERYRTLLVKPMRP